MSDSLPLKYRPRLWSQVVGQPKVVAYLSGLIKLGQSGRNVILAGSWGSGKCVARDTLIPTNRGLLPISDLCADRVPDTFSDLDCVVRTHDGIGSRACAFYYNGVAPALRLRTGKGYEVTGSFAHPVLIINVLGDLEFVPLGELVYRPLHTYYVVLQAADLFSECDWWEPFTYRGFRLPSSRPNRADGFRYADRTIPSGWSVDLAELLGQITADGYNGNNTKSVNLMCDVGIDPDMEEHIQAKFERLFGTRAHKIVDRRERHWKRKSNLHELVDFKLGFFEAKEFTHHLGITRGTAGDKRVPVSVLRSGRTVQAAFLRGYFEHDGSIHSNVKSSTIECCSKSENMIAEIQQMLLNFGIVSNRRIKTSTWEYKGEKKSGKYWYLSFSGGHFLRRFREQIGFLSVRKRGILEKATTYAHSNQRQNGSGFTVPLQGERVVRIKRHYHRQFPKKVMFRTFGNYGRCCGITLSKIAELRVLTEGKSVSPDLAFFDFVRDNRFFFDRPVEVADAGSVELMDISVPLSHSFNSAGLVSHNTSSGRIYAAALHCAAPTPDGDPCWSCPSCGLYALDPIAHPDYREFDGASRGGKAEIQQELDLALIPPRDSRYRVFLLDEVQGVSRQGFDSLLKVVEEPPEWLVFMFLTTELEKVRKPIRSRCAVLEVHTLDAALSRGVLDRVCAAENIVHEPAALDVLVHVSRGHPRDLLKNLEQVVVAAGEVTQSAVAEVFSLEFVDFLVRYALALVKGDLMRGLSEIRAWAETPAVKIRALAEFLLWVCYAEQRGVSLEVNPAHARVRVEDRRAIAQGLSRIAGGDRSSVDGLWDSVLGFLVGAVATSDAVLEIHLTRLHHLLHTHRGRSADLPVVVDTHTTSGRRLPQGSNRHFNSNPLFVGMPAPATSAVPVSEVPTVGSPRTVPVAPPPSAVVPQTPSAPPPITAVAPVTTVASVRPVQSVRSAPKVGVSGLTEIGFDDEPPVLDTKRGKRDMFPHHLNETTGFSPPVPARGLVGREET